MPLVDICHSFVAGGHDHGVAANATHHAGNTTLEPLLQLQWTDLTSTSTTSPFTAAWDPSFILIVEVVMLERLTRSQPPQPTDATPTPRGFLPTRALPSPNETKRNPVKVRPLSRKPRSQWSRIPSPPNPFGSSRVDFPILQRLLKLKKTQRLLVQPWSGFS